MGKNAIIGQSGGPTSVINASLAGIVETALKQDGIDNVLGMRYGIEGFMAENIIDFAAESSETLNYLKTTPSSALGSCRLKLKDEHLPTILALLKKYNIGYVFLIGGNDTMDTIHRLEAYAQQEGYDLIGVGIPKTVDNDLYGTDHTPGICQCRTLYGTVCSAGGSPGKRYAKGRSICCLSMHRAGSGMAGGRHSRRQKTS